MAKRILKTREYKLENVGDIKLKFGTTDRLNPEVVYLTGKLWVSHHGDGNCERKMEKVRERLRKRIEAWLPSEPSLKQRFVLGYDIFTANMDTGVRKLLTFDVLLRQRELRELTEVRDSVSSALRPMLKDMISDMKSFGFETHEKK